MKWYCIDQNILWYKFYPYRRALKILSSCIHLHLPSKPMYDFQYVDKKHFHFWVNNLLFLGLFQSNSSVSCTLPKLGNKSSVCDLIIHRPWPNKTTIPAVAELGAVGMGQSEQFRPERGSDLRRHRWRKFSGLFGGGGPVCVFLFVWFVAQEIMKCLMETFLLIIDTVCVFMCVWMWQDGKRCSAQACRCLQCNFTLFIVRNRPPIVGLDVKREWKKREETINR